MPDIERNVTRLLGNAGLFGAATFLVSAILLYFLVPNVNPLTHFFSQYANSSQVLIFTLGILVHSSANLGVAIGAANTTREKLIRIGMGLFGLSAILAILGGTFRTDLPNTATSMSGEIHTFAVWAGFTSELTALLMLSAGLQKDKNWRSFGRFTAIIAVASAISLSWLLVAVKTNVLPGLVERVALGIFLIWEIAIAWKLSKFKKLK